MNRIVAFCTLICMPMGCATETTGAAGALISCPQGWYLDDGGYCLEGVRSATCVIPEVPDNAQPVIEIVTQVWEDGAWSTAPVCEWTCAPDSITDNPALSGLGGFEHITQVLDEARIVSNGALESLAGLSGLKTVGQSLGVEFNTALSDLSLPALELVGVDLTSEGAEKVRVEFNPGITQAMFDGLVTQLGGAAAIGGVQTFEQYYTTQILCEGCEGIALACPAP